MARAAQQQIPGTETPKNKALSKALAEYADTASEFAKKRAEIIQKRERVLALMDADNLLVYEDLELGLKVSIADKKRTLKIKTAKEEIEDEEEDEKR